MIDYNLFYRDELPDKGDLGFSCDIFISAFNLSQRVNDLFSRMDSKRKVWLNLPDYKIASDLLPSGVEVFADDHKDEADFFIKLWDKLELETEMMDAHLCIDATGFIKPYLMTFIAFLVSKELKTIDVIFTEPQRYKKKHLTEFSVGGVKETKQVSVFGAVSNSMNDEDDILVIGVGYDDNLVRAVINKKPQAKIIKIFGFPSLRADMYQENIIRASRALEGLNFNSESNYLAPANDPFATAQTLHEIFDKYNSEKTNWYLSPLATKAQMLGFVLFYLNECCNKNVTILYPYSCSHAKETSDGISRIWKYTLEFPYCID